MIIPFYYIEDAWCFLEVKIKNNSYWIDWNILYDKNGDEISNKMDINITCIQNNTNIVCIENDTYYYYDNTNKIIKPFNYNYTILSIDGTKSFETLHDIHFSHSILLMNNM
jgi:hypothetical protein